MMAISWLHLEVIQVNKENKFMLMKKMADIIITTTKRKRWQQRQQ
jgi:hypothetical protein